MGGCVFGDGGLAVGSNGSGPTGFHPVMEEGNKSSRSVADKSQQEVT